MDEIENQITPSRSSYFEPAIDYVVVKMPKWPFDKFIGTDRSLGTQMKATGEVMAIGHSFESALLKAVRGAEISLMSLNANIDEKDLVQKLQNPDDMRLFRVFYALKKGMTVDEIYKLTKIDRFFLYGLTHLAEYEKKIENHMLSIEEYKEGKKLGYPDIFLEKISKNPLPASIPASYKMVDTCSGEYVAKTPYFYSVFDESTCESRPIQRIKPCVVVLGSGPIRIGQGIEFDYSSVHAVWTLREMGYEVVMINNNPETVSTDFDTADRLYFEPLTKEDVINVLFIENPIGVVVAFGGQTAIKLTKFLSEMGFTILGTSAEAIDLAEDRERFEALLESHKILRPLGKSARTKEEAVLSAKALGYPVLVRPSYVIGGQNMTIAYSQEDVENYMDMILKGGIENPVLIDQYLMGKELEVDAVCDGKDVLISGIMEHVERAGVHSGDSIAV